MTPSYPHLHIARELGISYGLVLEVSAAIRRTEKTLASGCWIRAWWNPTSGE